MGISFQPEQGYTVMLPETQAQLIDPQKAREAIERDRNVRRSHLYPLLDATARFACSLLIVPQGCEAFELPRSPWIVIIGDDMSCAWGPKAFGAEALEAAIKAAGHGVVVTSGPDPFPYRVAATVAARDRKNALIVESLPHQQGAWRDHIEFVRGTDELPITWCLAIPEKGAA